MITDGDENIYLTLALIYDQDNKFADEIGYFKKLKSIRKYVPNTFINMGSYYNYNSRGCNFFKQFYLKNLTNQNYKNILRSEKIKYYYSCHNMTDKELIDRTFYCKNYLVDEKNGTWHFSSKRTQEAYFRYIRLGDFFKVDPDDDNNCLKFQSLKEKLSIGYYLDDQDAEEFKNILTIKLNETWIKNEVNLVCFLFSVIMQTI